MKFYSVSYEKQGHSSINNWNKLQGRHSWGEAMGENGKKNECGFPFVSSQLPLCLLTIFSCEESELQNGLCAFNPYVPDMCCLHYTRKEMRQFTDWWGSIDWHSVIEKKRKEVGANKNQAGTGKCGLPCPPKEIWWVTWLNEWNLAWWWVSQHFRQTTQVSTSSLDQVARKSKVRPCPQNILSVIPMHCPHLGSRREKEAGWLRETWKRTVETEIKATGLKSWPEAASTAKDKIAWKERACDSIPHLGTRGQWWWCSSLAQFFMSGSLNFFAKPSTLCSFKNTGHVMLFSWFMLPLKWVKTDVSTTCIIFASKTGQSFVPGNAMFKDIKRGIRCNCTLLLWCCKYASKCH